MTHPELIAKIAEAARQSGFSQAYIARQMGKKQQEVQRWFAGTVDPTTKNLVRLCEVVGLEIEIKKPGTGPGSSGHSPPKGGRS